MNKNILFGFTLLLLLGVVGADCTGDLSIVDLPPMEEGNEYTLVVYTSTPPTLGIRDIDYTIKDPLGNQIYTLRTRLTATQSTIEYTINVDENFLNGTHTFTATLRVLEVNNTANVLCTETVSKTQKIKTSRGIYNNMPLKIDINWDFAADRYSMEKTATTNTSITTYNISCLLPKGWNITIMNPTSSAGEGNLTIGSQTYVPLERYNGVVAGMREMAFENKVLALLLNETSADSWSKMIGFSRIIKEQMNITKQMASNKQRCDDTLQETIDSLNNKVEQLNECRMEKGNMHPAFTLGIFLLIGVLIGGICVIAWLNHKARSGG